MKWETTESMVESAKKYADIYEDLAVKSYKDESYWRRRRVSELLRAMADKIKERNMDENSVVDFMKSKGLDSSFAARKHIAEAHYGIVNYTGTAEQNIKLLAKLKEPVAESFWDGIKAEFHKLFG